MTTSCEVAHGAPAARRPALAAGVHPHSASTGRGSDIRPKDVDGGDAILAVGGPISPACNRFPADGAGLLARMSAASKRKEPFHNVYGKWKGICRFNVLSSPNPAIK